MMLQTSTKTASTPFLKLEPEWVEKGIEYFINHYTIHRIYGLWPSLNQHQAWILLSCGSFFKELVAIHPTARDFLILKFKSVKD